MYRSNATLISIGHGLYFEEWTNASATLLTLNFRFLLFSMFNYFLTLRKGSLRWSSFDSCGCEALGFWGGVRQGPQCVGLDTFNCFTSHIYAEFDCEQIIIIIDFSFFLAAVYLPSPPPLHLRLDLGAVELCVICKWKALKLNLCNCIKYSYRCYYSYYFYDYYYCCDLLSHTTIKYINGDGSVV